LVFRVGNIVVCSALALILLALGAPGAHANWLTKLTGEAGWSSGDTATSGVRALDRASAHITALAVAEGAVLAAHLTPEGHWKFVNRDGEVFTAATADEMQRVVPTLLPDASIGTKLTIYLTEDSVFADRALLADLPADAALYIVAGNESFRLLRRWRQGAERLYAEVRPNLIIELNEQGLFDEALAQLERPLSRSNIRTLALEPGGPQALSSHPAFEPGQRTVLVDLVDPGSLQSAFGSVRGQTLLVTGRRDGGQLYFRPSSGPEQSIKIQSLVDAARAADVNLIILNTPSARQPGGRNWLWQRFEFDGLDLALKRATLADFLDALAANHGQYIVSVSREGSDRFFILAMPDNQSGEPLTGLLGEWLSEAATHITGSVATDGVQIHALSESRQTELDRRIIPWIPSDYQIAYLIAVAAGLLGWPVARSWWARIWPPERREEYTGATGFRAAQSARFVAFVLVFLPVVGIPALIFSLLLYLAGFAARLMRYVRKLFDRPEPKAG